MKMLSMCFIFSVNLAGDFMPAYYLSNAKLLVKKMTRIIAILWLFMDFLVFLQICMGN